MNTVSKCLFLVLLFAAPAYAQNVRVDNVTFSSVQGFPFLPGATITICTAAGTGLPCAPTVSGTCLSISDTTCNQSATQTSDVFGNYGFWIQPGSYTYTVTKAGFGGFGPKALTLACQIPCNVSQTFANLNNVLMVSNGNPQAWAGSDPGAWINAAEAALPASGGIIDARGLTGPQTFTTGVSITKRTRLLLGSGTFLGPSSGDMVNVAYSSLTNLGQGTSIIGAGKNLTIIQPVTAAQAHGIHFTPTNNSNVEYDVEDLTIQDSTQGGTTRTAGAGILADAAANPAQNSIGLIKNVNVYFMFNGIFLNRPITSNVIRTNIVSSKCDGVVLQGDGTSVTLTNVYSNHSGCNNFSQHGINYSHYDTTSSDHATNSGYMVDRQVSTCTAAPCTAVNSTGAQAVGVVFSSVGAEAEGVTGIYMFDTIGATLDGTKELNSGGDGIWMDGARNVQINSGQSTGNTGCGIKVTQSATPQFPSAITNRGHDMGGTGGAECGAAINSAYDSYGYQLSSNIYRLNRELQLGPGPTSPATPLSFFENTAPSGLSGADRCYGDSGVHAVKCNFNNDAFGILPRYSTTVNSPANLTGSASNNFFFDFGRTAAEHHISGAAGANSFFTPATAGDFIIRTDSTTNCQRFGEGSGSTSAQLSVCNGGVIAGGPAISLTGTGACATLSGQTGAWSGDTTCTGTTGAATLIITPGFTAPHFFNCWGSDATAAHLLSGIQSGVNATTCTLSFTSVTNGDVVTITAVAF